MNTYEERVREFAHQIWESEGRPIGHECRHWDMACKLVEGLNNEDKNLEGSGQILSVISPGEPIKPAPEPVPEIVPQPEQPDVPANPVPHQPLQPQTGQQISKTKTSNKKKAVKDKATEAKPI